MKRPQVSAGVVEERLVSGLSENVKMKQIRNVKTADLVHLPCLAEIVFD